ncbi:MAG TPA: SDR family oxidoreductase [Candidatus Paceibacterota bacterium]|nr:SDR family oxidoreductase [Candidatus Paceibacterota bacterium]
MEKTAIISGGMGGVGQAVAREIGTEYSIAILYRSSARLDAESFAASLPRAKAFRCDIADESSVAEAFKHITDGFERIDAVVHAAVDPIARATIEGQNAKTFRGQFEASVFGAFNLARSALPLLRESKGAFIAVTTKYIEENEGAGKMAGYIAAKFALRGFLRELSREAAPAGVRVNAVSPDVMRTKLSAGVPSRFFEFLAERDPRGRITTPEDVAKRIAYLLSPEGARVAGMSLSVESGETTPL